MAAEVGTGMSANRFSTVFAETHCVTALRDFLLSQALRESAEQCSHCHCSSFYLQVDAASIKPTPVGGT